MCRKLGSHSFVALAVLSEESGRGEFCCSVHFQDTNAFEKRRCTVAAVQEMVSIVLMIGFLFVFGWKNHGTGVEDLHAVVAAVIMSSETVDLGCLRYSGELPSGFRRSYFSYHAAVRLKFKMAVGLGSFENALWVWLVFECSLECSLVGSWCSGVVYPLRVCENLQFAGTFPLLCLTLFGLQLNITGLLVKKRLPPCVSC